jgi:hypothetical protein
LVGICYLSIYRGVKHGQIPYAEIIVECARLSSGCRNEADFLRHHILLTPVNRIHSTTMCSLLLHVNKSWEDLRAATLFRSVHAIPARLREPDINQVELRRPVYPVRDNLEFAGLILVDCKFGPEIRDIASCRVITTQLLHVATYIFILP